MCCALIKAEILARARYYVEKELCSDTSGHDWFHVKRVAESARKIALEEGADPYVCELAALLHDIPDDKRGITEEEGLRILRNWLDQEDVDNNISSQVLEIIKTMSFRGGNNPPMNTLEGKVVQDADRLDAIGAIGIARTFAYSGHVGQKIYDPDIPVRNSMSREEYRNGTSTAINHFYEKILRLESLLNTGTAKKIAEKRQEFTEKFLQQFFNEWNSGF